MLLHFINFIILMQQEGLQLKIDEVKNQIEYFISIIKPTEWKKAISKAIKDYHLHNFSLEKVTPLRLKSIHSVIVNKFYIHSNYKMAQWNENEFKTFIWLSFTYANAIKKHPFSFEQEEWICLSKCFIGKTPEFCEFQLKALEKKSVHLERWTREEDELLFKIISDTRETNSSKIKWMEVSQEFYEASGKKFIRSAKVCREHWNTHLDPTILKCPWSFNEDLLLAKGALEHGKKWVRIVDLLEHKRTEHDVKNRFFSLCGKLIKMKHLERSKEDIEADELYEWLKLLQQEVIGFQTPLSQSTQSVERQTEPPQPLHPKLEHPPLPYFQPISLSQKPKQLFHLLTHNTTHHSSPPMIISPLPMSMNTWPLMFPPMSIILRNQTEINYNLFSYDPLRTA